MQIYFFATSLFSDLSSLPKGRRKTTLGNSQGLGLMLDALLERFPSSPNFSPVGIKVRSVFVQGSEGQGVVQLDLCSIYARKVCNVLHSVKHTFPVKPFQFFLPFFELRFRSLLSI